MLAFSICFVGYADVTNFFEVGSNGWQRKAQAKVLDMCNRDFTQVHC
jgi:hypothetical protein